MHLPGWPKKSDPSPFQKALRNSPTAASSKRVSNNKIRVISALLLIAKFVFLSFLPSVDQWLLFPPLCFWQTISVQPPSTRIGKGPSHFARCGEIDYRSANESSSAIFAVV
ncbi:hypothetical protein CEXT_532181 [Caerostris extrusa]|uniref:Uncharacterized protein n=1 Tax=Caerostris extrusa TaxID=172846 RepID=A0AAV4YFL8_CAEEX|nr:hypothetical protein CEXT_532181 [Caerostris extrusa]